MHGLLPDGTRVTYTEENEGYGATLSTFRDEPAQQCQESHSLLSVTYPQFAFALVLHLPRQRNDAL